MESSLMNQSELDNIDPDKFTLEITSLVAPSIMIDTFKKSKSDLHAEDNRVIQIEIYLDDKLLRVIPHYEISEKEIALSQDLRTFETANTRLINIRKQDSNGNTF